MGLLLTGATGRAAVGPASPGHLGVIAVFILIAGYAVCRGRTFNNLSPDLLAEVTVQVEGRCVTCCGLVDTGNRVVDPVSGDPVIIIEYRVIRDVLPLSWQQLAAGLEGAAAGDGLSISGGWDRRLRMLPFRALQGTGGLMLGMRPDLVVIRESIRVTSVVVGVTCESLSGDGQYQALIPACFI